MAPYVVVYLAAVFISSVSQVMLKKAAQREYDNVIREYLNPVVIAAYVLFLGATLATVFAYRVVPLSWGPVLEATSYLYITFFGIVIFEERLGLKKGVALALILLGIVVYAFGGA